MSFSSSRSKMTGTIQRSDMSFFVDLTTSGSLGEAARDMGVTVAAVSKRLAQIEGRAGTLLLTRTGRKLAMTPEGEAFLQYARCILEKFDELQQALGGAKQLPRGLIRVSAGPGFGRLHVAPAIAAFSAAYPDVEVRLTLSESVPVLADDMFDVCIQFGEPPESGVVALCLAANERVICASPAYLAARGIPECPRDLREHDCIDLRHGTQAQGVWRFTPGGHPGAHPESIRIDSRLSTNDGPTAVDWALRGRGFVMRSLWNVAAHLESGQLVRVLEDWRTPDASIYAVYPQRHRSSLRVRLFIEHLAATLAGLSWVGGALED
jgi:LysR family transcriptional activator of dmlA